MTLPPDDVILRQMTQRNGVVGRYLLAVGAHSISNAQRLAQQKLTRRSGSDSYFVGWDSRLDTANPGMIVSNRVPHAGYIEDGTRPHPIYPTSGNRTGRLWFVGNVNGQRKLIGVRKVNHPGTRPYNILHDAVRAALRQPYNPLRR